MALRITIGSHGYGQVSYRRDVPHIKYTDTVTGAGVSKVHAVGLIVSCLPGWVAIAICHICSRSYLIRRKSMEGNRLISHETKDAILARKLRKMLFDKIFGYFVPQTISLTIV